MKNPKLSPLLLGITAVSAIASICLLGAIYSYGRQLRDLQTTVVFINQTMPAINMMIQELNAYSEKNPSIDPVLISAGVKHSKPQGADSKK